MPFSGRDGIAPGTVYRYEGSAGRGGASVHEEDPADADGERPKMSTLAELYKRSGGADEDYLVGGREAGERSHTAVHADVQFDSIQ